MEQYSDGAGAATGTPRDLVDGQLLPVAETDDLTLRVRELIDRVPEEIPLFTRERDDRGRIFVIGAVGEIRDGNLQPGLLATPVRDRVACDLIQPRPIGALSPEASGRLQCLEEDLRGQILCSRTVVRARAQVSVDRMPVSPIQLGERRQIGRRPLGEYLIGRFGRRWMRVQRVADRCLPFCRPRG